MLKRMMIVTDLNYTIHKKYKQYISIIVYTFYE